MTNIRENLPNNIREPLSLSFYLHKFGIAFGLCKNKNRQINIGHKYFRLAKICHVVMRWIPRLDGI